MLLARFQMEFETNIVEKKCCLKAINVGFQVTHSQKLQVRHSLPSLCSKYISVYLFSYEILFSFLFAFRFHSKSNGLAVFNTFFKTLNEYQNQSYNHLASKYICTLRTHWLQPLIS
jgi:hypothetical protein